MNLNKISAIALSVVFVSLLTTTVVRADEIVYSVKGSKQGLFKSESTQKGREGTTPVRQYQYGITSPRDAASGLQTGKRQHRPIEITKLWGASSAQLFQALVSNEILTEVIIEFYDNPTRDGKRNSRRVKLSNASVAEIAEKTEETAGGGARQIETISFTFQKIEYLDNEQHVIASDDISNQNN
jgi:type VI secretion system secreted protein Hcp